jgi:serine phosphatase RsbU (regulator of sigma subunit)/CHASE2 domain-containing sensor protein
VTEPRVAESAPLPAGRIRSAGLAILLALAAVLWWEPAWLTRMQAAGFDTYQALRPRVAVTRSTLIVEIDEKSIATLGQWPWPRTVFARLVRNIARAHPAAIGIDVLMTEPDRLSPARALEQAGAADPSLVARIASLPSNDSVLAHAITRAPVVLSLAGTGETTGATLRATPIMVRGSPGAEAPTVANLGLAKYAGVLGNVEEIDLAAAGRGLISMAESGGVIRRMPLVFDVNGTLTPALAVEMLRVAERAPFLRLTAERGAVRGVEVGKQALPTDRDGALRVYFAHRDPLRYVSALDVYNGDVDSSMFSDRFVLIGATGVGIAYPQATPLGEPMAAVEVQAQVIENMLDRTWLQRPALSRVLEVALFVAFGSLLIWMTPRFAPRNAAIVALACVLVPIALAYAAFLRGRWIFDALTPGIMLLVLFLVLLFLTLRDATRQRKTLEQVLQLSRENAARVAGEFAAAQRIQTGLLPSPSMLANEPRVELAASMTPAREVGGDLYDFFRLDERRLFFMVGDVAGKGLSASIFMAVSKALYKSIALRAQDSDVGTLMVAANNEVSRDNPEMLFVTAFAGILDLATGELAYCNAGHENPYLLPQDGGPLTRILDGDGPPLCAVDGYAYHGAERRLRPGEVLCVITDGVGDARNPGDELYGARRVEATLTRIAAMGATAHAVVDALRADVTAFAAGAEPADDLTVLALRWNGAR